MMFLKFYWAYFILYLFYCVFLFCNGLEKYDRFGYFCILCIMFLKVLSQTRKTIINKLLTVFCFIYNF
jgi:hypothetical protein